MASPPSQQAERVKIEQIVAEFFAKSLHLILESRIPSIYTQIHNIRNDFTEPLASSLSSTGNRTKDRWFNLFLGSCPAVLEDLEPWRRNVLEPMVVEVFLVQPKSGNTPPSTRLSVGQQMRADASPFRATTSESLTVDGDGITLQKTSSGTLLERWVVQFERTRNTVNVTNTGSSGVKSGPGTCVKKGSSSGLGNREAMELGSYDGRSGSGLTFTSPGNQRGLMFQGAAPAKDGVKLAAPQLFTHVIEVPALYKRAVIMLRSLYSRTRLLPAYRLFRLANSSLHNRSFSLSYIVSSAPQFHSETHQKDMLLYTFNPIETPYGRICLSVAYHHADAVTALEITPPIVPRIISDYVGSPTTDPLRFSIDPYALPHGGLTGRRGVHVVSLPSSVPSSSSGANFARRHSWNEGLNQVQSILQPPSSPLHGGSRTPSPSYPFDVSPTSPFALSPHPSFSSRCLHFDHSPSPSSSSSHLSLPQSPSTQSPRAYQKQHRSPLFSPSPSPPTSSHVQDDSVYKAHARSRSAPVSIPNRLLSCSPKLVTGVNVNKQSRNPLPPPSSKSRKPETFLRALSASPRLLTGQLLGSGGSPLDGKVITQLPASSESPLQTGPALSEVLGHEEAGAGLFSGVEIPFCNPCGTFPRRSGKGSGQDYADDEELLCPFAVDVEAEEQLCSRIDSSTLREKGLDSTESTGQEGIAHQRSQNAAVGILVRMLKLAPPLRNPSYSLGATLDDFQQSESVRDISPNLWSGSLLSELGTEALKPSIRESTSYTSKSTVDALEELRCYRDMRDLLLSQSRKKMTQIPTGHG